METQWTTPVIIASIVAIYGAILGTINIIINLISKKQHLAVTLDNGFLTFGPSIGNLMLFIHIANLSDKNVTINSINIKLPLSKFIPILNIIDPVGVSLPYTLELGKGCTSGVEMKELAQTLIHNGYPGSIKLYANVKTGTGQIFKSKKPWLLDLNKYI